MFFFSAVICVSGLKFVPLTETAEFKVQRLILYRVKTNIFTHNVGDGSITDAAKE